LKRNNRKKYIKNGNSKKHVFNKLDSGKIVSTKIEQAQNSFDSITFTKKMNQKIIHFSFLDFKMKEARIEGLNGKKN